MRYGSGGQLRQPGSIAAALAMAKPRLEARAVSKSRATGAMFGAEHPT